jgi:hypothetical protein
MSTPPVLTLDLAVELPVGLLVAVLDPELSFPLSLLAVCPAAPLVVVARVEATVLLAVAPGAAPACTMVTTWAPISVPKFEYWNAVPAPPNIDGPALTMALLQKPWSDVIWQSASTVPGLVSPTSMVYS